MLAVISDLSLFLLAFCAIYFVVDFAIGWECGRSSGNAPRALIWVGVFLFGAALSIVLGGLTGIAGLWIGNSAGRRRRGLEIAPDRALTPQFRDTGPSPGDASRDA
jgi:hypothetical protein